MDARNMTGCDLTQADTRTQNRVQNSISTDYKYAHCQVIILNSRTALKTLLPLLYKIHSIKNIQS